MRENGKGKSGTGLVALEPQDLNRATKLGRRTEEGILERTTLSWFGLVSGPQPSNKARTQN